jgi:hypothetical protein
VIRMSVTWLDSYRYYKLRDDRSLADFLADLRRESPPAPQMEAGRAWAKVLEASTAGDLPARITVDGWTFDLSRLDAELSWPKAREIKVERLYETPSGPVTLVGQVDAVFGITVRDAKLTEKIDPESKYVDALQWRAYLEMFGCDRFIYDVFQAKYAKNGDNIARLVQVVDYISFRFYRYPEMGGDVLRAVCELAAVIRTCAPEMVQPYEARRETGR